MPSQAWKFVFVKTLVELSPFKRRAVRFDYSPNVTGLTKKLACHTNN
jgi:hypothetical protein